MNHFFVLLAAAAESALDEKRLQETGWLQAWNSASSGWRQGVILFGVFLLVALALFFWAMFIRKPQRKSSPEFGGRERERGMLLTAAEQKSQRHRWRWFSLGRRRRRRRRERPRNPSLAEAGGLPPVRSNDSNDPIS